MADVPWRSVRSTVRDEGWAHLPAVLDPETCRSLARLWDDDTRFRRTIDLGRHGYGRGAYRYFARPLPPTVQRLRTQLYRRIVPIARTWAEWLGTPPPPSSLTRLLATCRAAEQTRPTPLLLRYGTADYNRLHQDRYGAVAFPLQVAFGLVPDAAYTGGEFLLVEQWPRQQSRGIAVRIGLGDAVVFANNERPVPSRRGWSRVAVRHGVSPVTSGDRLVLGIIFHDAA